MAIFLIACGNKTYGAAEMTLTQADYGSGTAGYPDLGKNRFGRTVYFAEKWEK